MNPSKVVRARTQRLTDLPNVGKAGAADLELIGVQAPEQLVGKCPYEMHATLCAVTGVRQDPCVIDVFISVTRFMAGEEPRPWWDYTLERKRRCLTFPSTLGAKHV